MLNRKLYECRNARKSSVLKETGGSPRTRNRVQTIKVY